MLEGYDSLMDPVSFGRAGLTGWRVKVADAVAEPVAKNSRLTEDQVRAAFGAVFFALSVAYVLSTAKRLIARR